MAEHSETIRNIYMMRHARTEAYCTSGDDFDRKLLPSGILDAQRIGQKLAHLDFDFDAIIASSARRTKGTVAAVNEILQLADDKITFTDKLYMAPLDAYEQIVSALPEHHTNVLIIGHNNGISDFVRHKVSHVQMDIMPTASVVGFQLKLKNWSDNRFELSGTFLHYFNPGDLK